MNERDELIRPDTTACYQLVDHNWQIKYILGSDTIGTIDELIANITFTVKTKPFTSDNIIPVLNDINFELTKSEMKDFIATLEAALSKEVVVAE